MNKNRLPEVTAAPEDALRERVVVGEFDVRYVLLGDE
jgi:hypothetical protein